MCIYLKTYVTIVLQKRFFFVYTRQEQMLRNNYLSLAQRLETGGTAYLALSKGNYIHQLASLKLTYCIHTYYLGSNPTHTGHNYSLANLNVKSFL